MLNFRSKDSIENILLTDYWQSIVPTANTSKNYLNGQCTLSAIVKKNHVYNDNFYNQNDASNKSTKTKVKKVVDRELELKSQKQRKIYLKQLQMGLQEGAGGESSTVLCFPKGMHGCPRVRDNYHSC